MRRLPRLVYGSHVWELPLADCSARALEDALLAPSLPTCKARLERLLREDPAVLLWTVCQGDLLEGRSLSTCHLAAQWLADHLLALLDWSAETDSVPTVVPHDVAGRFARLAGAGLATARLARHMAETTDGVCPDEAELAGLLTAAAAWCDGTTEHGVADGLPNWVARQRTGGRRRSKSKRADADQRGAWQIAARAASICGAAEAATTAGESPEPAATKSDAAGDAVARSDLDGLRQSVAANWLQCDDGVFGRLPALVTKLRRLDALEKQFDTQLETEKLEAMKELAYGAGHEINNPLANISARAQTLIKQETDPERRRKLAAINSQAFRAHEMISDLMLFARPPKLQPELIDLVGLVETVIEELAAQAQAHGTTLELRPSASPVKIMGDPVQLGVALRALALNSLEALGGGGQVFFEAHPATGRPREPWARLIVTDTGPGITAEVRRHLFDPFFSGREAGRGLGFGLSKCWRIVTDHGGRIVVDSPQGGGAAFTLYLPIAQRSVSSTKVKPQRRP